MKHKAKHRTVKSAQKRVRLAAHRRARIKFGWASARVASPEPPDEVVELSVEAFSRVGTRLLKPGIDLGHQEGVPLYYLDDSGAIIRDLDGRRVAGSFKRGRFVADRS